jgi:hypothetical protein
MTTSINWIHNLIEEPSIRHKLSNVVTLEEIRQRLSKI